MLTSEDTESLSSGMMMNMTARIMPMTSSMLSSRHIGRFIFSTHLPLHLLKSFIHSRSIGRIMTLTTYAMHRPITNGEMSEYSSPMYLSSSL